MSRTIWKFPLEITNRQTVSMPKGAEILTVQVQGGVPCLWALVEPQNVPEPRRILTHGTGHFVGDIKRYIGTYQVHGGALIFHVFEEQ